MEARVDAGSTGEMCSLRIRRLDSSKQVESMLSKMREDRALCERDTLARPQNCKCKEGR